MQISINITFNLVGKLFFFLLLALEPRLESDELR